MACHEPRPIPSALIKTVYILLRVLHNRYVINKTEFEMTLSEAGMHWHRMSVAARTQILARLRVGTSFGDMPRFWRMFGYHERMAMLEYLRHSRQLSETQYGDLLAGRKQQPGESKQLYRVGDKSKTRILPPVYHRLESVWMRSNHTGLEPEAMNTKHLRNTILLLKESAGNLQVKMEMLLGAMHTALRNQPHLQQQIHELFAGVNALDVDDLYPVFNVLQAEYATRTDLPAEDLIKLHGTSIEEPYPGDAEIDNQLDIDFNLKGW